MRDHDISLFYGGPTHGVFHRRRALALAFLLIGFVLSAYLSVPVLGIAIVGFAAAFWYFTNELKKSSAPQAVGATVEEGDDFDE